MPTVCRACLHGCLVYFPRYVLYTIAHAGESCRRRGDLILNRITWPVWAAARVAGPFVALSSFTSFSHVIFTGEGVWDVHAVFPAMLHYKR